MTPATSSSDKVICYIRRTREWAENFVFSGKYSTVWKAAKVAKYWDSIFRMSYIDFRKRLRAIQQDNFKEVGFDGVINQYEYKGERAIMVPTDEDDWYLPAVVPKLKELGKPIVYWNYLNNDLGTISIQDSTVERLQFESNNHALIQPHRECLADHVYANNKLKNNGSFYLEGCWSMRNRSLASLTVVHPICEGSKKELLDLYEKCCKPVTIEGDMPEYFMKYVDKMRDIYRNELQVRKTFF